MWEFVSRSECKKGDGRYKCLPLLASLEDGVEVENCKLRLGSRRITLAVDCVCAQDSAHSGNDFNPNG
jgi:hypothetical protein